ncbi:MAG TPA: magnesium/cobalt transporter CorA [Silvibacterium sp.]|jgi:magnesium transporter|nr:magnesium/cobalt transporter CorA [Silvibacterium sp.]
MLNAYIRFGDGQVVHATEADKIASAFHDPSAQFWLDIAAPDDSEHTLLSDVFGFHPLVIEDVVHEIQRPKLESYAMVGDKLKNDYFFLVIHGPETDPDPERLFQTAELDAIFSERYLITIHESPLGSLNEMFSRVHTDPEARLKWGVDVLLYELIDRLVDRYGPILDDFEETLDKLEEEAIGNPPPEFALLISSRKRELLDLRRIMTQQRDVIGQLTRGEVPFMGTQSRIYFRDVLDHLNREVETIDIYRDLVLGCRDIYMSSINNRLNRIMKTLAIISVVTLPLTVITSFFGMNFAETVPGFTKPLTFIFAMLLMFCLPFVFLHLFRKNDWL